MNSIVLKIPATYSLYATFIPLHNIKWVIKDEIISSMYVDNNDDFFELEDVHGNVVQICELNCKTYAELMVAIDLYNLNHNNSK